jgi:hypothetical protein
MSAMLALTQYPVAAYREQMPSIWSSSASFTQGPDALQRDAQAWKAAAHWNERPTLVLLLAQRDDFTYEHVLPLPTRTIKTRYRYVGRVAPREYPLDD